MKKLLLIATLIIIFIGQMAIAAPFVICDPDASAEYYVIILDSGEAIETPAPLRYDLSGIETGDHIVEVRAANMWGQSAPVPLEFTKKLPESITGLGLGR